MIIKEELLPSGLNHGTGRSGVKPDLITIHVTEGTADSARDWFKNSASKVSSHYLIAKNREIFQFVDEGDTAWANGRVYQPTSRLAIARAGRNPNSYTISIEHEGTAVGEWPETIYKDSAQLVAEIAARWGIPLDRDHIVGHREIYAKKTCPGKGDVGKIVRMARELTTGPTPEPAQIARTLRFGDRGEDVVELQKRLHVQPASGYMGPITVAAVKNFQRKNNLGADGIVGPLTRAKLGL